MPVWIESWRLEGPFEEVSGVVEAEAGGVVLDVVEGEETVYVLHVAWVVCDVRGVPFVFFGEGEGGLADVLGRILDGAI